MSQSTPFQFKVPKILTGQLFRDQNDRDKMGTVILDPNSIVCTVPQRFSLIYDPSEMW